MGTAIFCGLTGWLTVWIFNPRKNAVPIWAIGFILGMAILSPWIAKVLKPHLETFKAALEELFDE